MDLANLRGGPDNITVVIVRVKGPLSPGGQPGQSAAASPPTEPIHPAMWTVLGALVVIWPGALGIAVALAGLGEPGPRRPARRGDGPQAASWRPRLVAVEPTALGARTLHGGPVCAQRRVCQRTGRGGRELRDTTQAAAADENWTVDWKGFNAQMDQAAAASQAGDHAQAIRQYSMAISFLMAELKRQRPAGGSAGRH